MVAFTFPVVVMGVGQEVRILKPIYSLHVRKICTGGVLSS